LEILLKSKASKISDLTNEIQGLSGYTLEITNVSRFVVCASCKDCDIVASAFWIEDDNSDQ
jgi:hypothetical protein